jgi:uncharacterized protein YecE (DUF72 family)
MEFGRVPESELNAIDFKLHEPKKSNDAILQKAKSNNKPLVYIGCAKWGRKEWLGKIYPKGTKEAQFLDEYVHHYNSIELNATHYKIYNSTEIKKWDDKAKGHDFKFCPKIPNSISHYSSFNNTDALTDSFLEGIMAFGKHLGPVFLQVSDKYSPKRKENLYKYVETFPKDIQLFLEVRHPDWFADENEMKELLHLLEKQKIGFVITDTAGRRDCAHMHLSIPKTFIRYVGNSLHATDYTRIDDWIKHIKRWLEKGLQEIYFFMHMHDEAFSPELTVYLVDKLNAECGLDLQKPKFVEAPKLF